VRFAIWPGSALARRPPELVVAAEIVETGRTWARTVAGVEAAWVEAAAAHLVKRQHSEPHWSAKRASVVAVEKVSLYGVTIVADRHVPYGRIDPVLSRELFIRHALVQGEWRSRHHFLRDNRLMLERVAELEHRSRRRDIVVDDETLVAFYDKRIPSDVVSGAHFDAWWRKARHATPRLLTFTEDDLLTDSADSVNRQDFPDQWQVADLNLQIGYRFDPGAGEDGVTVSVPAALLPKLETAAFEWQVPGLRHDLVTALIRSLPKHYRRHLAPAPDNAAKALQRLVAHSEPLLVGLARELSRLAGMSIPVDAFDWEKVPGHLRVRVAVTGERGATVAAGKDIAAVSKASRQSVEQALDAAAAELGLAAQGLTSWTMPDLPRTVEFAAVGGIVTGYPALVDVRGEVQVKVLASAAEQTRAMRVGTRRLLLSQVAVPSIGSLTEGWESPARLALTRAPHASMPALVHDVAGAVVDELVTSRGGPVWQQGPARELEAAARQLVPERIRAVLPLVARILASARSVDAAVRQCDSGKHGESSQLRSGSIDAAEHVAALVHPGFVTEAGVARLPDLQRYLQSSLRRLQRLAGAPGKDAAALAQVVGVRQHWRQALADSDPADPRRDQLVDLRWAIEELRVSLLAPGMPTSGPISVERLERRLRELTETVVSG
jgi:ATP-dependent helicase HrpA